VLRLSAALAGRARTGRPARLAGLSSEQLATGLIGDLGCVAWNTRRVPAITGRLEVNLSVRNPVRSAAWYTRLLGMVQHYDHAASDGSLRYICLEEPYSGLVLCLVGHRSNPGEEFSEARTGLDHLEFVVGQRGDLDDWAERLDALGIEHSGVKELDYSPNAMVTFRDPDNIQLEFYWRAPAPGER
jgi:glyoxylase I family protein